MEREDAKSDKLRALLDELSSDPLPVVPPQREPLNKKHMGMVMDGGVSLYDATLDVCRALIDGADETTACELSGVEPDQFLSMMHQHPDVRRAVRRARATNIVWFLTQVRSAAMKDWKAAAFYLERRYPALYAEVTALARKEMPQEADINYSEDVTLLTDAELLALTKRGTKK